MVTAAFRQRVQRNLQRPEVRREVAKFDARLKEIREQKVKADRKTRLKLEKERQTLSRFRDKVRSGTRVFGQEVTFEMGKQRAQERVTKRFAPRPKKKEVKVLATVKEQVLSKGDLIIKKKPELVSTRVKVSDSKPKGEFKVAPKTTEAKLTRALTPGLKAGEFEKITKGVGTAIKEEVFGVASLVNLIKTGKIKNLKPADVAVGLVDYGRGTLRDLASGNSFRQARALTDVATWFIPVTIPAKIAKKIKLGDEVANSVTKYTSKKNIASGSTKINVDTKGITQANKPFTQKGVLRYDPNTKRIVGNVQTTIGKKKFKSNIKLKEELGFYVDTKTGIKIPKKTVDAKSSKVKIKEIKLDAKQPDIVQYKGDVKRSGQVRDVSVKDIDVVEVGKKRATRVKERASQVRTVVENDAKIIAGAAQQISKAKNVDLKKFKRSTGLSDSQIKRFLEFYNFDKKIIRGVDARTKIGRALGLRKDAKVLKKLEPVFEEGRLKLIQRKGFVKAEAVLEEVNPIFARLGISQPKLKGGKLLSKDIDNIIKSTKRLEVPDLSILLKTTKKLKARGLLGVGQLAKIIKAIDTRKAQLKEKKKAPVQKKVQPQKKKQIKVPIKKQAPVQKKVKAPVTKSRLKTKQVKKVFKPRKIILQPKPKIKLKLPTITIDFDSKRLDNRIATYTGKYRERKNPNKPASKSNPVISKTRTIKDTRNRALSKLGKFADTRTIRSIQIEVTGIGKAKKDISKPKVLKKFSPKKSKGTPVLKLVEKPKFALDKKGEQREVKRAKQIKGSTKKKTKKTVKVSTKKKKSSTNRSKPTKKR